MGSNFCTAIFSSTRDYLRQSANIDNVHLSVSQADWTAPDDPARKPYYFKNKKDDFTGTLNPAGGLKLSHSTDNGAAVVKE